MRILAYGDSNTFGIGPMPNLGSDVILPKGARWPDQMASHLPDAEVIVEGLPGRTTTRDDPIEGAHKNGLTILPAIIESHRPIDLLILCLGTNDLKARFNITAQEVGMGVGRLLKVALASGHVSKALAVAPPAPIAAGDFAEMFDGVEARGAGLAAQIERFATEAGAAFWDAGSVATCDPVDGIHFGAAAHAAFGHGVARKVKEVMA